MADQPDTFTPGSQSGSVAAATTRLQPPTRPGDLGTLDRYRVLEPIGEGGMGVIYLAIDTRLQRKVALKVIRTQYATSKAARMRFLKESRALAAVRHDNIVTLYDVGEANGTPYLAMEYLRGVSLQAHLRANRVPTLLQTLRITREIASGLAAAHGYGVVHRDIKPENIWLEAPHGRVKLIDFGLARPPVADATDLSRPGSVIGTPSYMPPEQARGLAVDHRADLYSLGAVLYELTTGRLPFTGETPVGVLIAVVTHPPIPPRQLNPHIPPAVESLILRLMAKDPIQRPNSAVEVEAELARLEAAASPLAAPVPPIDTIPTADPASIIAPLPVSMPAGAVAVTAPPEPEVSGLSEWATLDVGGEPTPQHRRTQRGTGALEWGLAAASVLVALTMSVVGIWIITRPSSATVEVPEPPTTRSTDSPSSRPSPRPFQRDDASPIPPFAIWRIDPPALFLASDPKSERIILGTAEGPVVRNLAPHSYRLPFDWKHGSAATGWVGTGVGRFAVTTQDGICRFYDPLTRRPIGEGITIGRDAKVFALSPDGTTFAGGPTADGTPMRMYATATGTPKARILGHEEKPIVAAAFSPDGKQLATVGLDGTARIWSVADGTEVAMFRTRFLPDVTRHYAIEFDGAGKQLLAYGPPGRAVVWNLERKTEAGRWEMPDLLAVRFSPSGEQVLIAGAGRWVSFYPIGSHEPTFEFDTQDGPVREMAFTTDRKTLMTAHNERVRFWDWVTIEAAMRAPATPSEPPKSFVSLFNGTDLKGWTSRTGDPKVWSVGRGALFGKPATQHGGWLRTIQEFANVELRFEYRFLAAGSDAGFAMRMGNADPSTQGWELNLVDDENFFEMHGWIAGPHDRTGAIYGAADRIAESPNRRLGLWNQVRAIVDGRKFLVEINGVRVQDTQLPAEPQRGHIGFQANVGRIQVRNVFVRELALPVADDKK